VGLDLKRENTVHPTNEPIMKMSPWAKLIMFRIPYTIV
jgi:hypothetical protein